MTATTARSPHIGRRVSVFPPDARLPERKARIIGGSRSKGFQVVFEDGAAPQTALVGPSGYRYINCQVCGLSRCICA